MSTTFTTTVHRKPKLMNYAATDTTSQQPNPPSPPLTEDANLKEGWVIPFVHPTIVWFVQAIVAFVFYGLPFLLINVVGLLLSTFVWPFKNAKWWSPDDKTLDDAVAQAFAACDAVEEKLGAADPEGLSKGKVYPAVSCLGVGHKSGRYFGLWYYLVKHGLVDFEHTHMYGYSMASIVTVLLAAALREEDHDARLAALKKSARLWISYGMEFLPNALTHPSLIQLSGGLIRKLEQALPEDVSYLKGRLHIILTRVSATKRPLQVVSDFTGREDLISAVRASSYWPWQFNLAPVYSFRGEPVIDGGYALQNALPDSTSPETAPCMMGRVRSGEGASVWTSNLVLQRVLDPLRLAFPLFRAEWIAEDFAAGYEMAHAQHKQHLLQLATLKQE